MDWQNEFPMTNSIAPADIGFVPNSSADEPIYLQLTTALCEAIRSGRIAIGAQLPSERLYARHLGVSRTTITAAYQELKAMGLLRGFVGRGAIVAADDPDRAAAGAVPWSQLASRPERSVQASGVALDRGLISFGDGWPHPSLTPRTALLACASRAAKDAGSLTRAAPILGLPVLREALIEMLRANGVKARADEVLITGGAQQGLNVVAQSLISPGDAVVCESPTWHGAFRAFRAAGAAVAGAPMDREGIDPNALEDVLVRLRPKFVYLIPSFQCPTGRLMGLERRRRILEICARFRTPILESHVYGDIAFGEKLPSLRALDAAGIVIHQGSASKTISAALRLGWLIAPPAATALLAATKARLDLSTPALVQAVLASFLANAAYARHQAQLRAELRTRRDALIGALNAHCPELRCVAPQGGLYLWAQLPQPIQGYEFEAAAAAEGVSVRGGEAFLPEAGTSSHVRLCFAAPAHDEITVGARRLGKAMRNLMQRHKDHAAHTSAFASV
jgi:2-aminoadipate transaminase